MEHLDISNETNGFIGCDGTSEMNGAPKSTMEVVNKFSDSLVTAAIDEHVKESHQQAVHPEQSLNSNGIYSDDGDEQQQKPPQNLLNLTDAFEVADVALRTIEEDLIKQLAQQSIQSEPPIDDQIDKQNQNDQFGVNISDEIEQQGDTGAEQGSLEQLLATNRPFEPTIPRPSEDEFEARNRRTGRTYPIPTRNILEEIVYFQETPSPSADENNQAEIAQYEQHLGDESQDLEFRRLEDVNDVNAPAMRLENLNEPLDRVDILSAKETKGNQGRDIEDSREPQKQDAKNTNGKVMTEEPEVAHENEPPLPENDAERSKGTTVYMEPSAEEHIIQESEGAPEQENEEFIEEQVEHDKYDEAAVKQQVMDLKKKAEDGMGSKMEAIAAAEIAAQNIEQPDMAAPVQGPAEVPQEMEQPEATIQQNEPEETISFEPTAEVAQPDSMEELLGQSVVQGDSQNVIIQPEKVDMSAQPEVINELVQPLPTGEPGEPEADTHLMNPELTSEITQLGQTNEPVEPEEANEPTQLQPTNKPAQFTCVNQLVEPEPVAEPAIHPEENLGQDIPHEKMVADDLAKPSEQSHERMLENPVIEKHGVAQFSNEEQLSSLSQHGILAESSELIPKTEDMSKLGGAKEEAQEASLETDKDVVCKPSKTKQKAPNDQTGNTKLSQQAKLLTKESKESNSKKRTPQKPANERPLQKTSPKKPTTTSSRPVSTISKTVVSSSSTRSPISEKPNPLREPLKSTTDKMGMPKKPAGVQVKAVTEKGYKRDRRVPELEAEKLKKEELHQSVVEPEPKDSGLTPSEKSASQVTANPTTREPLVWTETLVPLLQVTWTTFLEPTDVNRTPTAIEEGADEMKSSADSQLANIQPSEPEQQSAQLDLQELSSNDLIDHAIESTPPQEIPPLEMDGGFQAEKPEPQDEQLITAKSDEAVDLPEEPTSSMGSEIKDEVKQSEIPVLSEHPREPPVDILEQDIASMVESLPSYLTDSISIQESPSQQEILPAKEPDHLVSPEDKLDIDGSQPMYHEMESPVKEQHSDEKSLSKMVASDLDATIEHVETEPIKEFEYQKTEPVASIDQAYSKDIVDESFQQVPSNQFSSVVEGDEHLTTLDTTAISTIVPPDPEHPEYAQQEEPKELSIPKQEESKEVKVDEPEKPSKEKVSRPKQHGRGQFRGAMVFEEEEVYRQTSKNQDGYKQPRSTEGGGSHPQSSGQRKSKKRYRKSGKGQKGSQ